MNQELRDALPKAADRWAQLLSQDTSVTDQILAERVDDLLMRLDEFDHLLDIMESEDKVCQEKNMPLLRRKFEDMEKTFDKIDRLEVLVTTVKQQMDQLEQQLVEAEATVSSESAASSSAAFISLIRPILSRAGLPNEVSSPRTSSFEPIDIFSTEQFFKKNG